ncbi:MAG: BlaI/MecI/CopY family transcriptional regulator [Saprospiraceae bacterium]
MEELAQPTEAELEVLQALWENQPATVREVHERIERSRPISYTTILTQLQRLHAKGLLERERRGKQHVYRGVHSREEVERGLLYRLADHAFGGSAVQLALRALGDGQPTPEELDQLEKWVAEQKNKQP